MRKKKWLIDAHNLMHQIPDIKRMLRSNHLEAMRELCRRIGKACSAEKRNATVVFDGVPLMIPGNYAGLKLLFSRERTADEVIMSLMAEERADETWILVTDDREIRHKAFYHHVEILRCRLFIDRILETDKAPEIAKGRISSSQKKAPKKKVNDPGAVENPPTPDEDIDMFLKLFSKDK